MSHNRYLFPCLSAFFGVVMGLCLPIQSADAQQPVASQPSQLAGNVLLITIDGLRWQEVFGGADGRLISSEAGVKNIVDTQGRFLRTDALEKRKKLMPFFWSNIATKGVVYGEPSEDSFANVTNGQHFSYPGYSEILCGVADARIDSNAKTYNENVTVLEWLHQKPEFRGRIAAFCSWDVFPFIINDNRSGVLVNAGWTPAAQMLDEPQRKELVELDTLAAEIPHQWEGVRFDYFTFKAAEIYLQAAQPRVLYVALGETDDWAHEGRYDLYLDAAQRNDDYIRRLWETMQSIPQYRDNTTLVVTTDHGRGDTRDEWKSHNTSIAGCDAIWIAAMGPGIQASKATKGRVTQSQVAATVAAILGYDFASSKPNIASALPCVLAQE